MPKFLPLQRVAPTRSRSNYLDFNIVIRPTARRGGFRDVTLTRGWPRRRGIRQRIGLDRWAAARPVRDTRRTG